MGVDATFGRSNLQALYLTEKDLVAVEDARYVVFHSPISYLEDTGSWSSYEEELSYPHQLLEIDWQLKLQYGMVLQQALPLLRNSGSCNEKLFPKPSLSLT